jgi:hypothetical protein
MSCNPFIKPEPSMLHQKVVSNSTGTHHESPSRCICWLPNNVKSIRDRVAHLDFQRKNMLLFLENLLEDMLFCGGSFLFFMHQQGNLMTFISTTATNAPTNHKATLESRLYCSNSEYACGVCATLLSRTDPILQ